VPRSVQLLAASTFSPGLRLDVDAFQLGDGESPDLLNVDLDTRGGVALRKAVTAMNDSASPFAAPIHSLFEFAKTDGTEQVLVGSGKYTYYSTGSNFTSIGTTWTTTDRQRAVAFRDALYIQNGTDDPRKWTGSAVSNLAQTASEDLASPDDGDMPIAQCITAWQGYVWVANTVEDTADLDGSTAYGSRLRFSHPNRAEDWRYDDYIDIDVGHDGDEITALVPLADRLLVFKHRSLHAVTGYDPDTFSVNFVASVGAPSQEAVVATEYGVYFFTWPEGVHLYTDRGVSYQFDALFPAIRNGDIPDSNHEQITLGWLGRRVFVSVPWGGSSVNSRVFVLTPGKGGGWTQYDLPLGPMLQWRRRGSESHQLAATSGHTDSIRVLRLDQDDDVDTWYTDYLELDGSSSTYATTADSAATSLTGNLDLRILCAMDDWTPSAEQKLISKENGAGTAGYALSVSTNGRMRLIFGSPTLRIVDATAASANVVNGEPMWYRCTRDNTSGDTKFYESADGTTWTQLGATVTANAGDAPVDGTDGLRVGANSNSGASRFAGKVYYAEVRDGIGGTVVASPDFTAQAPDATSFDDEQGNTWTLTGAATLSAQSTDIESYYMTRWYDAGSPSVIKRWKRPDLVYDADYAAEIRVGVFRDYEPTVETKWFTSTITAESEGMLWGTGVWGTDLWGATDTGAQTIDRGGLLGRARAISLKFTGPTPSKRWSVNSIGFKYIPRRVR
jgi:hypothetical protein